MPLVCCWARTGSWPRPPQQPSSAAGPSTQAPASAKLLLSPPLPRRHNPWLYGASLPWVAPAATLKNCRSPTCPQRFSGAVELPFLPSILDKLYPCPKSGIPVGQYVILSWSTRILSPICLCPQGAPRKTRQEPNTLGDASSHTATGHNGPESFQTQLGCPFLPAS